MRFSLLTARFYCEVCESLVLAHPQVRDHEGVVSKKRLGLRRRTRRQLHVARVTTQQASYHLLVHQLVEGGELVGRWLRCEEDDAIQARLSSTV